MTAVFTINWSMCRILQNACSSCRWSCYFSCSEYAIFCDKIVRIMRPEVWGTLDLFIATLKWFAHLAKGGKWEHCSELWLQRLQQLSHGKFNCPRSLQISRRPAALQLHACSFVFWVCWELKQGALLHPFHCTAQWHYQWWQFSNFSLFEWTFPY